MSQKCFLWANLVKRFPRVLEPFYLFMKDANIVTDKLLSLYFKNTFLLCFVGWDLLASTVNSLFSSELTLNIDVMKTAGSGRIKDLCL